LLDGDDEELPILDEILLSFSPPSTVREEEDVLIESDVDYTIDDEGNSLT